MPGGGFQGILRTDRFWDAFWDAFWMVFGGPSKIELSLWRGAHFGKLTFFALGRFLMGFLMKNQAHKVPKGHEIPGHEVPAGVDRSAAGVRNAFWMVFGGPAVQN